MKALVYHSSGDIAWEEKPMPQIKEPTDAIVKILKTTICRTDLQIMKGNVPTVAAGSIIGHEGVGVIVEAGSAVSNFKEGEHVLISSITSCGKCKYCKKAMCSHCENGGWILGNLIDGTQAEYVRIPFADNSLCHILANVDEEALVMLSDILPIVFELRVLNERIKPTDAVAIVGVSPMGLTLLITAHFYNETGTMTNPVEHTRLNVLKSFEATDPINIKSKSSFEKIISTTKEKDIQVTIEALKLRETFELCEKIITSEGHIVNLNVYGKNEDFHFGTLLSKNKVINTSIEEHATTSMLSKTISSIKVDAAKLITHRYKLSDIILAYDVFEIESEINKKSLKVILTNK